MTKATMASLMITITALNRVLSLIPRTRMIVISAVMIRRGQVERGAGQEELALVRVVVERRRADRQGNS